MPKKEPTHQVKLGAALNAARESYARALDALEQLRQHRADIIGNRQFPPSARTDLECAIRHLENRALPAALAVRQSIEDYYTARYAPRPAGSETEQ